MAVKYKTFGNYPTVDSLADLDSFLIWDASLSKVRSLLSTQMIDYLESAGFLLGSNNLSDLDDPATARGNLLLADEGFLVASNNLSDLDDPATARGNLGVDASRVFDVTAYGALGDGVENDTASISSGSAALTCTDSIFAAGDVGKKIVVYGAGASGAQLMTSITGYTSPTQVTLASNASTTVSGETVYFATDDRADIMTAYNSIPASGGTLYFPAGKSFGTTATMTFSKSNINILFDTGAEIRAMSTISNTSGRRGILNIESSTAGTTQKNVWIIGGTLDLQYTTETNGVSIWGAGNDTSVWTTENIVINGLTIKKKGNSTNSVDMIKMRSGQIGGAFSVGRIKNVTIKNCKLTDGDQNMIDLNGDYFDGMRFYDNEFNDNSKNTIMFSSYIDKTNNDFVIANNRFINTKNISGSSSICDITDAQKNGGYNIRIVDNFFSNKETDVLDLHQDAIGVNLHNWQNYNIERNIFEYMYEALSIGQSNAGTAWAMSPSWNGSIKGNIFRRLLSIIDNDANVNADISGNVFMEIATSGWKWYSAHTNSRFHDNILYNCNYYVEDDDVLALLGVTSATLEEYGKAAILSGSPDTKIISNNLIIDDRELQDPGSSACTFSETTGGSLSSRTYYVQVVYTNETGQTLPSDEQMIAVSANKLLTIKPGVPEGYASNYYTTLGIRGIDIYIGTSSGNATKQTSITYPNQSTLVNGWTEPSTGLVSGDALPTENTTHHLTKYGMYTLVASFLSGPNFIQDNIMIGPEYPFGQDPGKVDLSVYFNNWHNGERLPDRASILLESGYSFDINIKAPDAPTLTASSSGGTLASDVYYYSVTALDIEGNESTISAEKKVTVTGPTGKVTVSYSLVPGATSYRIYRSTDPYASSREYFTSTSSSYVDTGTTGTAGSPPSRSSANRVHIGDDSAIFGSVSLGDVSGVTSFSRLNGEKQFSIITGNVTSDLDDGTLIGEELVRIFEMGGTGSYTFTAGANELLAGGSFTPTATVGKISILTQIWDGTNWIEKSRALNI